MTNNIFSPGLTEYVGVAAGHTIGMVIANPDPAVRMLLEIPDKYPSIAILTSRVGAAAQAFAIDEAAKSAQADLLRFELPRDTEGYSGHGNLFVLGCPDISDARRLVELALARIDENAERIYINEVGHMEMHYTAHAGVILHQLFDAPLQRGFGFICAGPAGISIVAADAAMKAAPVEVCWYGTASYRLSMTNEVIVGITGDYSAVKKAVDTAYQTASTLMETFGSKPESILYFNG
ncbi:MAG: propanediol utilization microcompartment protein PduB [Eubacterium sp.]|nr:propanediol utilization microcompartment protein PduB [Eubacterium sp.]